MLVHLALFSGSLLLGPPPPQRLELSFAPAYAQAPEGRDHPSLAYQRVRLQAGLAYTADTRHTLYLAIPVVFARHESPQGIEYRHGDLGDAHIGATRWLDPRWHMGLEFSIPLTRDLDADTYAQSAPQMPTLDEGRLGMRLDGGWTQRTERFAVDFTVGAAIGLDSISLAPLARASGSLVLLDDALEAGAFADGRWGLEDGDDRWLRVGLVERIGPRVGLSGEIVASTILAARNTEAATEAGVRIVWRR